MNEVAIKRANIGPNLWRVNLVGFWTIVRKETRRVVRIWIQIASHHIRSAHEKSSASFDAFDLFQFVFHARNKSSGRTVRRREQCVHRHARTAFCRAVTLENAHAEATRPCICGGFLQFFRSGK